MYIIISINNADVYKQHKFTYTGEEDHLSWEEYGVKLHFPPYNLSSKIEGTVSVLSASDDCVFPEGSKVVSAVYDISTSQAFPVMVAVELEHCVQLSEEKDASLLQMSFVVADTRSGPPYQFYELKNGTFGVGSYGRIELNRFSRIAISIRWHLGFTVHLFTGVYYLPNNEAVFAVAKNLRAHINVSFSINQVGVKMK